MPYIFRDVRELIKKVGSVIYRILEKPSVAGLFGKWIVDLSRFLDYPLF